MFTKVIAIDDYIIDLEGVKYIYKDSYGTDKTRFNFYWEHTSMSMDVENSRVASITQLLRDIMKPVSPISTWK